MAAVREGLDLTPGSLGLALVGLTGGAIIALPLSGALVARYGSRRVVATGLKVYCPVLPLLALAPNLALLTIALLVFGAGNSMVDVAMNAHGVEVERLSRRPRMSGFHGLWSLGGLTGAVLGAGAAALGVPLEMHFALAGSVLLLLGLLATHGFVPDPTKSRRVGPAFAWPTSALALLSAVAFLALLAEGVVNDWSTVYLRDATRAPSGLAAGGYAAFSLTMAVGRIVTDRIVERTGPGRYIRVTSLVAALGLGLAVLAREPVMGVAGLALTGFGLAGTAPLVLGMAGHRPGRAPAPDIAAVSTFGYLGFLAGPVLVGLLSEFVSLRFALAAVGASTMLMGYLGGRLGARYPSPYAGPPSASCCAGSRCRQRGWGRPPSPTPTR